MASDRKDPYGGYNFKLEINGTIGSGFKSVAGLDTTTAVIRYRNGDEKTHSQRAIAGLASHSNITLTRGYTVDPALWDWRRSAENGKPDRQNVSIVLLDDNYVAVCRWTLSAAWPVKWTGPSFDASSDAVAIESLELAHEGIDFVKA